MPDEVTPRFKPAKAEPRRRAWNSTMPAASGLSKRSRKVKSGARNFTSGIDGLKRSEVFLRAGGRCQADGLHHKDCPGVLDPLRDWSVHHIRPRSKGGDDEFSNLITVWCPGGLGLNGCHGLHRQSNRAELMGLLDTGKGTFGLGKHLPARFWDKVDIGSPDECWPWLAGRNPAGYGRFNIDGGPQLANRLALGLSAGDPRLACHHCDNPPCVNPLHLYVGDHRSNAADKVSRGRVVAPTGAGNGKSAEEDEIFTVRWLAVIGTGQRRIAEAIGKPHNGWVSRVVSGKRWPDGPWPKPDDPESLARAKSLGLPLSDGAWGRWWGHDKKSA